MLFKTVSKRFFNSASILLQEATNAAKIQSSCAAGTAIKVNVKKGGKDPIALEDKEYPEWLWTVLDEKAQLQKLQNDPIKLRKKQLRKSNRADIKQRNFLNQI